MKENDYLLPATAAIALAVMFPAYWIYEISVNSFDFTENYYNNIVTLSIADCLFLIIGLLSIYLYLSFKKLLHEQLNFHQIDLLLVIMVVAMGLFSIGLFTLDAVMYLGGGSWGLGAHKFAVAANQVVGFGCVIVFGLVDILIGFVLLRHSQQLPDLLKLIAVISMIQGFFEITIIFSYMVIFIYPVYLLVLATYFLKKPEMLEVV